MAEHVENREFRILSALAMILVIAGHIELYAFDVAGMFPYYSFHVMTFVFISGYFYKKEAEENIFEYIKHKALTLLLPYYLWNLFYGLLTFILHKVGFSIGQDPSFYTLIIAPFDGGHQFMYNFPAWFVTSLFLIEVANVCMRKILSYIRLNREWFIFACCLIAGILTAYLAMGKHVYGWYKIPGRVLFMLPAFQMGRIYKEKLETHDKLPSHIYFLIIMAIQMIICVFGAGLAFGAVWVDGFANGPVMPYVTTITGIAFWLRIAKLLANIPEVSDRLCKIGRNTFSLMMHHMFACFLLTTVFFLISKIAPLCASFDVSSYLSDINYRYLPAGIDAGRWLYLLVGIEIPMGIARICKKILK